MIKNIFIMAILFTLAGCAGNQTSMQDVTAYCRSYTTNDLCDSQNTICAKYSEIMLHPYKSVKDCRQSCEQVKANSWEQRDLGSCNKLFEAIEDKCNEFCDASYK
ncbi:hypothetical protein [Maridesulfovibrio zosterae]|uniref:hypothetical protein n=1 Tax=Maridesulfovibrio zosterae TaxID=82171 RepID=UPI0004141D11|nr:hypothetical protein [Maridesulfovibrio zosterae]